MSIKGMTRVLTIALFLLLIMVARSLLLHDYSHESRPRKIPEQSKVATPMPLLEYVQETMLLCGATGTPAKSLALAQQITDTVGHVTSNRQRQEYLVGMICIESAFNPEVRASLAGAIGITQIMPKLFPYFAKGCGYPNVTPADIHYSPLNLRVGTCYLNQLLDKYSGNFVLALAEYNGGSRVAARISKLHSINTETANYVAKFSALTELMRNTTSNRETK